MKNKNIQDLSDRRLLELNYIHQRSIDKSLKFVVNVLAFYLALTIIGVVIGVIISLN